MEGQTDRRKGRGIDEQMEVRIVGRKKGRKDRLKDRLKDRWTDRRIKGRTDK